MTEHGTTGTHAPDTSDYVHADWQRYRSLEHLINHWDRPGWTPGRRSYHWILSLAHQPELHALATACQQALTDIPTLDLVPVDDLHLTLQRAGFTDQLTPAEARTVAEAARPRCAALAPLRLTIGPLAGSAGAVRFSVGPHAPVVRVRAAVRAAIADVYGDHAVPARSTPFIPHASIAYNNTPTSAEPTVRCVAALRSLRPVTVCVETVDLVELRREHHRYTWHTVAAIPLSTA